MASPIGTLVPLGGSNCAKCEYVAKGGKRCANKDYIASTYPGKKAGEDRFVDGVTEKVVTDPRQFCCNFFDWTRPS